MSVGGCQKKHKTRKKVTRSIRGRHEVLDGVRGINEDVSGAVIKP